MKVSKKSWHYRWMSNIGFRHPGNLCAYFWTTIWSILVFPVAATVAAIVAVVATLPFWAWLLSGYEIQHLALVIGVAEIISLFIWLCVEVSDRWETEKYQAQRIGTYVGPGIVKQYLRAKHEKVCPFLEFEE